MSSSGKSNSYGVTRASSHPSQLAVAGTGLGPTLSGVLSDPGSTTASLVGETRRHSTSLSTDRVARPAEGRTADPVEALFVWVFLSNRMKSFFTGVMQRMGLERVVRVGGIDVAHIAPLAEPALDDVDVVHPTRPRSVMNRAPA
jgi:hypothetical protein